MSSIGQLFASVWNYLNSTISGGYVLAIAVVCFVQYGFHVYRQSQARKSAECFRREKEGLEGELKVVEKDRMVSRLENHILREFVAETEIDKALGLLLHHFVPSTEQGFAVFVKSPDDVALCDVATRSRGLSNESHDGFRLDRSLRERALKDGLVIVQGDELRESELGKGLSRADRDKAPRLFVASISHADGMAFMLVTTALYPAGAALEQQIELAKRLMASVAGNLKRTYELELQEDQYRMTNDVLALRSIADRQFEAPTQMLAEILAKLAESVAADRAVLTLCGHGLAGEKSAIRAGRPLPTHTQNALQICEDTLIEAGMRSPESRQWDAASLAQLGMHSHMRTAFVLPLVLDEIHIGVLCLSKQNEAPFDRIGRQLIHWAGDFLAETIRRVLTHAAVEQQARQDGLTELANRRTFDHQFQEVVARSVQAGSECSLLLLDIDRFKLINDTYGHPAGDEVLRQVAAILKEQVRRHHHAGRPLAARYGGEEMAVLLPGVGSEEALRTADAIRRSVEGAAIRHQDRTVSVTLSAGVATLPDAAANAHELLTAADAALYHAKETGRNNVRCAAPSFA